MCQVTKAECGLGRAGLLGLGRASTSTIGGQYRGGFEKASFSPGDRIIRGLPTMPPRCSQGTCEGQAGTAQQRDCVVWRQRGPLSQLRPTRCRALTERAHLVHQLAPFFGLSAFWHMLARCSVAALCPCGCPDFALCRPSLALTTCTSPIGVYNAVACTLGSSLAGRHQTPSCACLPCWLFERNSPLRRSIRFHCLYLYLYFILVLYIYPCKI